ncbi:alpha/beta hydrolase [Rhodococcus qingshengii]|uniref:alpha/beta hydrolase n=1 Tax=Rhodococcus qingshengii TaxID=334542 RepID=UPI0036D88B6F
MELLPLAAQTVAQTPGLRSEYYEVRSEKVDADFAVWVTCPVGYESNANSYPVVYVTDGNTAAPTLEPFVEMNNLDLICRVEPYIQVAVGYVGREVHRSWILRCRDLVPPEEPLSAGVLEALEIDSELAGWSEEEHNDYLAGMQNGQADRFLRFLEEELHPFIEGKYRTRRDMTGLFGFSYGGLFSLYALLQEKSIFSRLGAGSPGVLTPESQIFTMMDRLSENGFAFGDTRIHLTVNALEITGKSRCYRELGIEFARLINEFYLKDFPGLIFTSRIHDEDATHITGFAQSFHGFLRACYSSE